jgi:hypothetical protein
METFLTADHCLSIAAGFIAIVGACASLLNISSGKADSLANRYRELTKEFRVEAATESWPGNGSPRLKQLHDQIHLFKKRVNNVAWAQRFLFATLVLFVASIAVFIAIGMRIIYFKVPEDQVYQVAQRPMEAIGLCVLLGVSSMFTAVVFLFVELMEAVRTFRIEAKDCLESRAGSFKGSAEIT